jgi:hypothetical protein
MNTRRKLFDDYAYMADVDFPMTPLAGIHFCFRDPLVVLAIASPFGEKGAKK